MQQNNPIIFGPVASRRFGISLGVDLSPEAKQCNFDCLYCELKASRTVEKMQDFPQVAEVITAIKKALEKHKKIDVVTVSANGEPTLYPHLDELIDEINKIKKSAKTLILSNGSTIYNDEIFATLLKFDIVKLSLDCADPKIFKKLDRPNKTVKIEKIANAMQEFSKFTKNDFILEVLFVKGLNDTKEEIEKLHKAILKINPTRVDIGTVDRPPAYKIESLSYEDLEQIAQNFKGLNVQIVYKNRPKQIATYSKDEIISLLKRRPLTLEDVENLFDELSQKELKKLIENGTVSLFDSSGVKFYKIL